jgi:hypothetical protein
MIKKAVFEEELVQGMQRELQPYEKKQGMNNLVRAVEYLQAAAEIFEESGLSAKSDQVLRILLKIASDENDVKKTRPVQKLPSINKLFEHGLSPKDLEKAHSGDPRAIGKVNLALHKAGYSDEERLAFLGEKNFLPLQTAERWTKENPIGTFQDWMTQVLHPSPEPGDVIEMTSMVPKEGSSAEDAVFKSLAQELGLSDDNDAQQKPHKPKNPTNVSDRHTKGLTSEKMVENMKGHGSWFNAADDNNVDFAQPETFEEDYQKWLEMTGKKPKSKSKSITREDIDPDLGDLVVFDEEKADDLEMMPKDRSDKTFEDSD